MSNSCANGSNAFRVIRVVARVRTILIVRRTENGRTEIWVRRRLRTGGHDARKVLKDHAAVAHSWRDGEQ